MLFIVNPRGGVHCLYSETIDLTILGKLAIQRASRVEPNGSGQWLADLRPVAGPVLGPFSRRSEALSAEVRWLEQHWLVKETTTAREQTGLWVC